MLSIFMQKDPCKNKNANWVYCRNYAMGLLLYSSGMRISELVNLPTNCIYSKNWILVENSKNNKSRYVPIATEIVKKYIKLYKDKCPFKPYDFLWFSSKGIKLKIGAAKFAIKNFFGYSPHYFRHAFATHLIQNNYDIKILQEMLGHSYINTTQLYLHSNYTSLFETMQLIKI